MEMEQVEVIQKSEAWDAGNCDPGKGGEAVGGV